MAVSPTLGTCPFLGKWFGHDPLVCRFMRGIQRLKPPKTKLFPSWELVTVLKLLMSWGKTKELLLRKPIIKTAFLVAVVCAKFGVSDGIKTFDELG